MTPPDACVSIIDCTFTNCVVEGRFRVASGSVIDNVRFDAPRSSDMMIFNSESVLSGLVLKGGRECGGLWVKPAAPMSPAVAQATAVAKAWAESKWDAIALMIDSSGLDPHEVAVLGLPLEKLRWNMSRHVAISHASLRFDMLAALALPNGSFWWHRLRSMQSDRVTESVFSLPREDQGDYAEVMRQRDELLRLGVIS